MSINDPHSFANFMGAGWRGNFELSQAFWRYYVFGRIAAYVIGWLLFTFLGFFGWFLGVMVWTVYWFWSLIMLWRCAPNTDHAALFYGARILVVADALYAFARPPLFEFAAL